MKNEFHRTKFYKPELLRKDEDIRKISFCTETGQKVSKAVNQQGSKAVNQQVSKATPKSHTYKNSKYHYQNIA